LAWMVWVKVGGTGEQATSDLLLPMKWFYTVSAVGATAAAILSTVRVIQMWRNSTALPEQEEAPHGA